MHIMKSFVGALQVTDQFEDLAALPPRKLLLITISAGGGS